jgi:dihydroorotate dehydrogenase
MASTEQPINLYARFLRPLLFHLDPESAHQLVYDFASVGQTIAPLIERSLRFDDALLTTEFAGRKFANPVGLAAGFDKNAKLGTLLDALGFGFAEIGSVTGQASTGNPRPRLFRLPDDQAVINRLAVAKSKLPLAVNIAKTNHPSIVGDAAVADLLFSYRQVKNLAVAYITVNASCPNTHEGIVQEVGELKDAMLQMQSENQRNTPFYLKLSPDSSDSLLDRLLDLGRQCRVSGYICGNTSLSRDGLKTDTSRVQSIGRGGLSGPPIKPLALSLCRRVLARQEVGQTVIACGGIASGEDVFQFLRLGVSAVQIYTSLIYRGPGLVRSIKQELAGILKQHGTSVSDVVRSAQNQPLGL